MDLEGPNLLVQRLSRPAVCEPEEAGLAGHPEDRLDRLLRILLLNPRPLVPIQFEPIALGDSVRLVGVRAPVP